ncbi:MAG TPA: hypothetical protein VMQ56_03955 [Terracidiphilus sp.]|jgi:hypothetical protein|nr:hypothetical protein [Terracidiphilus sp.]
MAVAMLFAVASAIHAQTFTSIPAIPFDTAGPLIQAHAEPLKPFTVAGERGVVLGQQDGTFEAWVLPVELLSHLTIEAEVEGNETKNLRCRCPQPGLQKLPSSAGGIRYRHRLRTQRAGRPYASWPTSLQKSYPVLSGIKEGNGCKERAIWGRWR